MISGKLVLRVLYLASLYRTGIRAIPLPLYEINHDSLADLDKQCQNLNFSEPLHGSNFPCLRNPLTVGEPKGIIDPIIAKRYPLGGEHSDGTDHPDNSDDSNDSNDGGDVSVIGDLSSDSGEQQPGTNVIGDLGGDQNQAQPGTESDRASTEEEIPNDVSSTGSEIDESIYAVNEKNWIFGLVSPDTVSNTFDAAAKARGISQQGTWFGWTAIDFFDKDDMGMEPHVQLDNVRQAIKNHLGDQSKNPSFMSDILPEEARAEWNDAAETQVEHNDNSDAETWNRISNAFGNWLQPGHGDNFYVVTHENIDVFHPHGTGPDALKGNFGSFEIFPITDRANNPAGQFENVFRININPEGGALTIDPNPLWTRGQAPIGDRPNEDWMTAALGGPEQRPAPASG